MWLALVYWTFFVACQITEITNAISNPPPYWYIWNIDPTATEQTLRGQDGDTIVLSRLVLN